MSMERKIKKVKYTRDGVKRTRRMQTTSLICHKCGKRLSGRRSPTGKPSIVFKTINGKRVPLHRTCYHYYIANTPKGSGYSKVTRLTSIRRRPPRKSRSRGKA